MADKKVKLIFVTVPFSGHFNILSKFAKEISAHNKQFDITFLITGWFDININEENRKELIASGIKIIELNNEKINSSQPLCFTFPRVTALTEQVITCCEKGDFIIYDFFAIEGYIAGKKLNIATVCSIPAIMGPFLPENEMLQEAKKQNRHLIEALEKKYDLEINAKLEMVSDGFLLPSDNENIQWSWPNFIKATDYQANRQIKKYQFMRPLPLDKQADSDLVAQLKLIKLKKKIVYVSLGTVVTQNLWEKVPQARNFIRTIFNNIKEKFQDSDKFEIVIATGRNPHDIMVAIPKNFHIFESVAQPEILAIADIFVTHAGGNSVNEAIDAGIPMIAIPFFGDQHLCANNISQLKIGISFPADDSKFAVDTLKCFQARKSLEDKNAIKDAVSEIINNQQYQLNIKDLKKTRLMSAHQFEKLLINNKILSWQEGDLLYGCNADRMKLAAITGREHFFRLCEIREFPLLFNDINNRHILPKIIDQYHDVLTLNKISTFSKFVDYDHLIVEYQQHIQIYLDQLKQVDPKDNKKHNDIIWDMCVAGLDFFIKKQKKTIHFVIGQYNDQINLATRHELKWLKNHWQDGEIRTHVKFYNMQDGKLIQVYPEQSNWFAICPTPSFEDIAPAKVDENMWKSLMQSILSKPHLFFNRYPERYKKEVGFFEASGIQKIDIKQSIVLAKNSLVDGDVHIFIIQKNGKVVIAKRITQHGLISHAVLAANNPVICAGELRLRSICVKGKWLKALDISNRSGHYCPNASTLKFAIQAFEEAGYIVHRVNAIKEYIPETLSKVEDAMLAFESITKAASI